jgi:stage V sporulation protein G
MGELITDVRVFPVNHDRLKANVSFTVAGGFAIHAKVVQTQKGLMVSMPSQSYVDKKDGETKYKDLAHPVTGEARAEMNEKLIEAYKAEVSGGGSSSKSSKKKAPF